MATITQAIEAIQNKAAALSGMIAAPHEPPEAIMQTPFAVSYLSSASYVANSSGWQTILATITTDIFVARVNLPVDYATIMPYADSFPNALQLDPTIGSKVDTITGITCTTQSQKWGDNTYLVLHFQVSVKQNPAVA